jgi:hypothetical protein
MSLADDVRGEIKAAKKVRVPGWGAVCGIIASLLCAQLLPEGEPPALPGWQ